MSQNIKMYQNFVFLCPRKGVFDMAYLCNFFLFTLCSLTWPVLVYLLCMQSSAFFSPECVRSA